MPEHSVSRTLVKSPPELWAELSDPAALARHLGELGEITITRLEPEREVAWEGERMCGTVALEPAGWGTRVTLEVAPSVPEAPPESEPDEPVAAAVAEPDPEPEPEPEEPAGSASEDDRPVAEPVPPAASRGLLARLTGWWRRPVPAEEAAAVEPPAAVPEPEPEPELEPEPATEATAADGSPAAEETRRIDGILTAALEALGAAHHRPFSRG